MYIIFFPSSGAPPCQMQQQTNTVNDNTGLEPLASTSSSAEPCQMPQQTVKVNESTRFHTLASTSEYQIEISTKLSPTTNPVWAEEFEIPWGSFPQRDMIPLLQKGMRPKQSARREMVRLLSNEISKITNRPGKKALTVIAQKIVKTYPNSFQDEIEGSVVGTGYDSLVKQLQARFDNLNRKSNDKTSKRKWEDSLGTEVNDMSIPGSTKKMYLHDNYGCINYMPNDYPDGESETTQEEKKALLQQKYKQRQNDEVEGLMKDTYTSQRKDLIENKMDVPTLQITWPYLFEQVGMFVHFKELTGISIKEKMDSALMLKGEKILKWMEEEPSKHIRKIREELVEAQASISNGNAEATAVICAVASYLHEEEKSLYTFVEVCYFCL